MKKKLFGLAAIPWLVVCGIGAAAIDSTKPAVPDFLPSYYASILEIGNARLTADSHLNQSGIDQYAYKTGSQTANIIIGNLPCAPSTCESAFNNFLKASNKEATANLGAFHLVSPYEYSVEWKNGALDNFLYVSRLAGSLLIWNYSTSLSDQAAAVSLYFDRVHALINRQRYEQALAGGNVELGRWGVPLRQYADHLLKNGQKQEALNVLASLVATSPTDYLAQSMLARNTGDSAAAQNSARVVFQNTESPELISKSAQLLHEPDPASVPLPVLDKAERGLQVILIPLEPCDIGLLGQVSKIYFGITRIPVKIMRLGEAWNFGPPDRIPDQRQIQQFIVAQRGGSSSDFTGWTLQQYKAELLAVTKSSDALTKFSVSNLLASLDQTGQYSVNSYLEKLADILAKYRSEDARTMYVGITEANISSGDANFLFSDMVYRPEGQVSILSYHMMLSKTLNAPYESRSRLTERIAKELVPATLNALKIPRAVDPADPFSYSSGVDRLDQKTLVLSKPTEDALAKFR